MLNFKRNIDAVKKVTIHDGYGTSIEIPSTGYVNSVEYSEAMEIVLKASDEGYLYNVEQKLVALMLASRFNLDKNIPPEKLLTFDDGTPIGAPMLKALYNFFIKELGASSDMMKFPFGNYPNLTSIVGEELGNVSKKRSKKVETDENNAEPVLFE